MLVPLGSTLVNVTDTRDVGQRLRILGTERGKAKIPSGEIGSERQ